MLLLIFSFAVIYLVIFIKIVVPFLAYGGLTNWDTIGHFFAIWFNRNFLFPSFSGWNPYFYAGYPQGTFYPPLFHYLTSGLSFCFGISGAIKLMIILPILFLPIAFFYFARHFGLKGNSVLAATIIFFLLLFLAPSWLGGGLQATFISGTIVNNFSLPFYLFYLVLIDKKIKEGKPLIPSICLSLLILTHLPTAAVSFLATLVLWALNYGAGKTKQNLFFIFSFIVFTVLVSAFWLIPFIYFMKFSAGESLEPIIRNFDIYLLISAIFLPLLFKREKRQEALKLQQLKIVFLIFMILSISLLGAFRTLFAFLPLSLHFYRIQAFAYWLSPVLILSQLELLKVKLTRKILLFLVLLSLAMISFTNIPFNQFSAIKLDLPNIPGRILFTRETEENSLQFHAFSSKIPIQNPHNESMSGLFMEGSLNSYPIMFLLRKLSDKNFIWGIPSSERTFFALYKDRVDANRLLKIFNITHLLIQGGQSATPEASLIGTVPVNNNNVLSFENMYLQKVGESQLIEPLNYIPEMKKGSWKKLTKEWLIQPGSTAKLIINKATVPNDFIIDNAAAGDEKIQNIQYLNSRKDSLSFFINSQKPIPLIVKISYFPNWHAYQNGQNLPVMQISPSLIFIYAKGQINLEYETSWVEKLSWIISLATITLLGLIFLCRLVLGRYRQYLSH